MALAESLLAFVVDAALGGWLGAMAFFSFVAAPRLFDVLERPQAGRAVGTIFPRYYEVGIGLGLVAVAAGIGRGTLAGFDLAVTALVLATVVGVAAHAYARWLVVPALEAAGDAAFDRYHRQSVLLNGVAMLAAATALVASHL